MNSRLKVLRPLALLVFFLAVAHCASAETRQRVRLTTDAGTIVITLFNETPAHRDNFVRLVREGYYDGLLFHRVIRNFMVQTGDPDSRHAEPGQLLGDGGPDYTLPLEVDLPRHFHYRGAVAAAREPDDVNPERRSSGSQFYIVWGQRQRSADIDDYRKAVAEATGGKAEITDEMAEIYRKQGGTPHLDGQYTVFGEIEAGAEVVDAIQRVETDTNDRPLTDIRIIRAEVLPAAEVAPAARP